MCIRDRQIHYIPFQSDQVADSHRFGCLVFAVKTNVDKEVFHFYCFALFPRSLNMGRFRPNNTDQGLFSVDDHFLGQENPLVKAANGTCLLYTSLPQKAGFGLHLYLQRYCDEPAL